jgi:hypothetical protein
MSDANGAPPFVSLPLIGISLFGGVPGDSAIERSLSGRLFPCQGPARGWMRARDDLGSRSREPPPTLSSKIATASLYGVFGLGSIAKTGSVPLNYRIFH